MILKPASDAKDETFRSYAIGTTGTAEASAKMLAWSLIATAMSSCSNSPAMAVGVTPSVPTTAEPSMFLASSRHSVRSSLEEVLLNGSSTNRQQ